jgi:CheY-like chemotaxis protein
MAATQLPGGRVARILLVEDDPDDADITRRALDRAKIGNPITLVEDGEAALNLLLGSSNAPDGPSIDLILLDLSLPKLDGRALLKELHADKRLRHIPVIILTGSEREDDLVTAYKSGAVAFLRKPVDVERFLTAIGDLYGYRLYIARTPDA